MSISTGGRLFEKKFVENVIQRLDELQLELQKLKEFKRKVTTTIEQNGPWISSVCAFCEKSVGDTESSYQDWFRQCDCCGKVHCYKCWNADSNFIIQPYRDQEDILEIYCCKECRNVDYVTCEFSGKHIDCEDTFGNCDVCDKKWCEFCTLRLKK